MTLVDRTRVVHLDVKKLEYALTLYAYTVKAIKGRGTEHIQEVKQLGKDW